MFVCPKSGKNMVSVLLNLHDVVVQSQEIYCCRRNIKSTGSLKKGKISICVVWFKLRREKCDGIQSLLGKSCLSLFFLEG